METSASLQSSSGTCRVASKKHCAGQQQQETQLTGKAVGHGLERRRGGMAPRSPEQHGLRKSECHSGSLEEWRLGVQDLGLGWPQNLPRSPSP